MRYFEPVYVAVAIASLLAIIAVASAADKVPPPPLVKVAEGKNMLAAMKSAADADKARIEAAKLSAKEPKKIGND